PMFSEAMELKAQITGKEVTASDNSSIKSFVRRQVMAERASGAEVPTSPDSVPLDMAPTSQPANNKPATQAVEVPEPADTQPTAQGPATRPSDETADVHFRYPSQNNEKIE